MLSAKKVLYAIFSGEGIAILVPVKKGQKINWKILQRCGIEEIEKMLPETESSHWLQICLTSK